MAANLIPLINGKTYEYADITCIILGVPIIGVTAIEYGEEANIENIYATGRYPVARGYGQVEPTAKVTILMNEVMNIVSIAPQGRLHDIPEFDIIVSFTDANLIPVVQLDLVISNVEFI
jgi:hypothetical protein